MLIVRLAPFLIMFLVSTVAIAASGDFSYVRAVPADVGIVIADTRAADACRAKSLEGARCLPSADFIAPQSRLPDERNLLWLLGTAGLTGDEHVLVVGDDAVARDFVAGILHVAGQRDVRVLTEPVSRLIASGANAAPGRGRASIREAVYTAPMRDGLVVLRRELVAMRPWPVVLDGRSDREYRGESARAVRTGHLPGAISLPAARLRAALDPASARPLLPESSGAAPIAYAHDAYEGLAYLTLLVAGHGVRARLYAEGWSAWATDGSLPADAVGYPESARDRAGTSAGIEPAIGTSDTRRLEIALVIGLALTLAAFALGRRSGRRRHA